MNSSVEESPGLDPKHPIQVVARRTGLTPDVIRVWERRYEAVAPRRTPTNRRLYSDADVERLLLLRRATLGGRRIGDVARMPREELRGLIAEDESAAASAPMSTERSRSESAEKSLEECMEAIEQLDAERLEALLAGAALDLSPPALIEQVMVPMMHEVGERWRAGTIRPVHEHLATSTVRSFLGTLRDLQVESGTRPDIVVTTPAGQVHEIGALVIAVTSALEGWRVTYLGPDLPAAEIAAAAKRRNARAVALSVVHPADDPRIANELKALHRMLPEDCRLIVGGAAAGGYDSTIADIGAVRRDEIHAFRDELQRIRYGDS